MMDMQNQAMGYDRAATMFSPEGSLLQVEYAEKAIRRGSASIGMKCSDGIFILADKRAEDTLIVKESANKIYEIDSHVFASVAGIISDARILIEKVQVLSQQHKMTYDSDIEPELIIREIANTMQQFTQYGGARPYGVSLMVAGLNDGVPELYTSDVTGNYFSYHTNAIGENDEKIKNKLREKYKESFDLKKGINLALTIFEEINENKFDVERFELLYLKKDGTITRVDGMKIKEFVK
jgi:proteasome alpha subunit